ncbi:RICIN domain-containing protein [Streptomyces sp. NPDC047821]|uniref:RICIN domain-containing protein n=1 Tax=Streptomyces sp. NPDC047821 TaxID=3365488 RepID=UPI00371ADCFD
MTDGAGTGPGGGEGGVPPDAGAPGAGRFRVLIPAMGVLTLAVAAFTVVAFVRGGDAEHPRGGRVTAPAAGAVDIRAVHSGLCLNERPGRPGGRVYQVPCAGAVVPRYSLVPLDGGLWRLHSDHPERGPGCAGVPGGAGRPDGAPLLDQECGTPGTHEAFRIEDSGDGEGYRIRAAHADLCLEVRDASAEPWADVVQRPCGEDGAGAGGRLFSFDRRP